MQNLDNPAGGICDCCQKWLSIRRLREHRRLLVQRARDDPDEEMESQSEEGSQDSHFQREIVEGGQDLGRNQSDSPVNEHNGVGDHDQLDNDMEAPPPLPPIIDDWNEQARSEAGEDDDGEHMPIPDPSPSPPEQLDEGHDEGLMNPDPRLLERLAELYNEEWLEDAQHAYEDGLQEEEIDNLVMFAIRLDNNLSRKTFNAVRRGFAHKLDLRTEYRLQKLVDRLAENMEPVVYHCCVNLCCLFVGPYEDLLICPYCQEARHTTPTSLMPRQTFLYIPVIPRLQGMYANPSLIETLQYRATYDTKVHQAGEISDVFDGAHYRSLRQRKVVVNQEELDYCHFSGDDDIALGLAGDGVQIFRKVRRGSATATPMILVNYNLPLDKRTHLENVLCLGVIPGPKGPKDVNSFLWPYKQEYLKLARGVPTFHATRKSNFHLRAYTMFGLGDIPWITKVMGIKGHNGFSPCRACDIQGISNPAVGTTHYVPLRQPVDDPRHPGEPDEAWDAGTIPQRTHESFADRLAEIRSYPLQYQREALSKSYGLNTESIMSDCPGIDMARSFPYEYMHLLFENTIPDMIRHWRGKFKGMGAGDEDYIIPEHVWEIIGAEAAAAVKTIPSAFVGRMPNIATDQGLYKAEYYLFWFTYLAPILLHQENLTCLTGLIKANKC